MLQDNEGPVSQSAGLELRCTTTYRDRIENEVSLIQLQATVVLPRWTKPSARLTLVMLLPERHIKRTWNTPSMRKAMLDLCGKHSDELLQFAGYIDYRIANCREIHGPFSFLKDVALAPSWSRRVKSKDAIVGWFEDLQKSAGLAHIFVPPRLANVDAVLPRYFWRRVGHVGSIRVQPYRRIDLFGVKEASQSSTQRAAANRG